MTREEKSKAIEKWCLQRDCNKTCPLFKLVNIEDEYELCYTMDDPDLPCNIDRNYDILVKAGLIVSYDEIKTADDEIKRKAEQAFADASHKLSTAMRDIVDERNKNAVQHPAHYCKGGIECIQAIKASMTADGFCDYCKGNIIKYLWRWRDKGGAEDLHKARVYLDWLIEAAKGCRNG